LVVKKSDYVIKLALIGTKLLSERQIRIHNVLNLVSARINTT